MNEIYYEKLTFDMQKLKLSEAYRTMFYSLRDDAIIDEFNVVTLNFRFAYENKTGLWVKQHIKDLILC